MQGAALILLSAAWLCWFPVFAPEPALLLGSGFASTAWGCLVFGQTARTRGSIRGASTLGSELLRAFGLVLAVLSLQYIGLQILSPIAANHHELSLLSPVLALCSRCLGIPAVTENSTLFLRTEEDVIPFLTNWEKVGFVMPACIAIGVIVAALLQGGTLRERFVRMAWNLAVLGGYQVIRYLALCLWLVELGDAKGIDEQERLRLFTGIWPTLLSYVPLAWLLSKLPPSGTLNTRFFFSFPRNAADWMPGLGMALALGLVAAGPDWVVSRHGEIRSGEVVWDDFHSGFWEPSRPLLDTRGFGSDSLYNASSLVEWLRLHRPVRLHTNGLVTAEKLRGASVFVLKTPTRRLEPSEISELVAFVERGGGLLLVGDHTNLLGMSSYLNELAARFDIEFQLDGSNAYSNGYFSSFRAPWLGAHSVVEGLPELRFLTSCTLRHGRSVRPLMIARDVMSDPVDYSKPSFFGKLTVTPRNGFGLFPLAVAKQHGKGRVIAFAESTTLSNFAAFQDATPEFYLRVLTYLCQEPRGRPWDNLLWAVPALAACMWSIRRSGRGMAMASTLGIFLASAAGWTCGQTLVKWTNRTSVRPPEPTRQIHQIAFLTGSHFTWEIPPAIGPLFVPPELSFDALFVVPQRFGAFPALVPGADLGTRAWNAVVAVNPKSSLPARERSQLASYVSQGGQLLVLDPGETNVAVFPAWIGVNPPARPTREESFTLPRSPSVGAGGAGAPAQTPSGSTLRPAFNVHWTAWTVGAGKVHVLTRSATFSRAEMGNVLAEPDVAQREAYAVLFRVFQELVGNLEREPL